MRPGHHRPLGTSTKMRFPDWPSEHRAPELGDVVAQTSGRDTHDEDDVRRAYRIDGIEETRTGYRLVMTRVEYETLPESLDPTALWTYYSLPR